MTRDREGDRDVLLLDRLLRTVISLTLVSVRSIELLGVASLLPAAVARLSPAAAAMREL